MPSYTNSAGFDELDEKIFSINQSLSGAELSHVLHEACIPMLNMAIRLCPVETGRLQDNISLGVKIGPNSATAVLQVLRTGFPDDQYYARFIEYGTVKMPAQPFMRPAFEAHKRAIQNAVEQHLNTALRD